MAFNPMVMPLESTNAPPTLSIRAFQEMTMTTGSSTTMIEARRLRHWVVRSARSRAEKTAAVEGSVLGAGSRAGAVAGAVVAVAVPVAGIVGEEMVVGML